MWGALSDERTGISFTVAAGANIFYCLRFETSLFVASYDSQGYGGSIRPRLHTGVKNSYKQKFRPKDTLNLKEGEVIKNVAIEAALLIPFRPYPKTEVLQEMRWASGSCTEQYDSSREMLQC
jgi:hypothetical protein